MKIILVYILLNRCDVFVLSIYSQDTHGDILISFGRNFFKRDIVNSSVPVDIIGDDDFAGRAYPIEF